MMEERANVVEVQKVWNTTTSLLILVEEVAQMYQIFSYFVRVVIEVNQIVVFVKFTIEESVLIVVIAEQLNHLQLFRLQLPQHVNAREQHKKELDVEI